jgi:hypothetical protein
VGSCEYGDERSGSGATEVVTGPCVNVHRSGIAQSTGCSRMGALLPSQGEGWSVLRDVIFEVLRLLRCLNHSADQVKETEVGGNVAWMREERKVYKILVGNTEGKRPLEIQRHRWENGTRKNHREIGRRWSGFNWFRIGTGGGLLWMRWWTFGF